MSTILYRTESYDNMPPVGQDPRWEAFGPFHDYLLGAFPLTSVCLGIVSSRTTYTHYITQAY